MSLIINGEKVEDSVIRKEVERLRPDYEKAFVDMDPKERETQLLDWSKENVIERILLKQEIKNINSAIPKDHIETILARLKKEYENPQELYEDFDAEDDGKLKEVIELMLKTEQRFSDLYKDLPKPSQAEIEKFYEENKEQFRSSDRVRAAHIVKYVNWRNDEATAHSAIKQAQGEIEKGTPFEVVIDKYTDDPNSGNISYYFTKGEDVEELEDVIFNLSVGEVSDIFRTRYGFHIAKVYERKPGTIASLKEVKKQIVEKLTDELRQMAVNEFIDQLKNKAKIEEI
jgi:parvulin-like peptidyl-prolyl isomerase